MPKYTDEQLQNFKKIFDSYDLDHNGALDRKEFAKFLQESNLEEGKLDLIFYAYDENKDNLLKYEEFQNFIADGSLAANDEDIQPFAHKLFNGIDLNKDGKLNVEEISLFFQVIGIKRSRNDIEKGFQKIGVQELDFDQFYKHILIG
jgi:Ca2+-binding EF-hand superfamily protein